MAITDLHLRAHHRSVLLMSGIVLLTDTLMSGLTLSLSLSLFGIWSIFRLCSLVLLLDLIFFGVHLFPPVCHAPADELKRITLSSGFVYMMFALINSVSQDKLVFIWSLCLAWPLCVGTILVGRWAIRSLFCTKSWWGVPVVIIGAGQTGRLLVDRLLSVPRLGLKPVIMFDDNPSLCGEYRGLPVVFGTPDAANLALDNHLQYAIVAMPGVARERVMSIIDETIRVFPYLLIVPDMFGMSGLWVSVRDINGILTLESQQRLMLSMNVVLKRVFDVLAAFFGGIVLLPFIGLVALWVRLDSKGPVFYGHTRLGKDGKPFKAWKFRSMIPNADAVLADRLAKEPELRKEWEENFKLKNDPRITRVGRFLRRTSLDELPQIWNILRGEMSVVGPRPIIADEVSKYGSKYKLFASVKPGLTGLWQISGRSDISYPERVELDIYYVRNWSIWLDLYIVLKTVLVVLGGGGAY